MKKISLLLVICLAIFITTGCGKEDTNKENSNGTSINSKEEKDIYEGLELGKTKVENKGNSVVITTHDGQQLSKTEYIFKDNVLTTAKITFVFPSKELAKTSYNQIKNEPALIESYSKFELKGDTIIGTMASSLTDVYSSFNQQSFYEAMQQAYANITY